MSEYNKSEKISTQEIMEDITFSGETELFHDQYGEAYISLTGDGRKVLRLNSNDFKQWISSYCWKRYELAPSISILNNVIQAMSGEAKFASSRYELFNRYCMKDEVLWYDCGEKAVRINKDGWEIIDEPPIIFRRYGHQTEQVLPEKGGSIDELRNYINIENEDDLLLFIVYTVISFLPDFPHPLLILYGPQGAGKSTPMKLIKGLIDPSLIKGVPSPRDVASFAQLAHHHAFLFFDNLSGMPTWLSDALARVSTGDGFSKRALYTDDDDIVYAIQRPIALNGINQVITKPDLLDRSILLRLKRIEPGVRLPEDEFWSVFEQNKAKILGAIFTILSRAIAQYPDVYLESLPRMADFTKWGYAVAESMGGRGQEFVDAYKDNINRQNEEAIEASPVAQALLIFMDGKEEWKGTAAELLRELNKVGSNNDLDGSLYWPKDPQWLSKRLNEVEPNLQSRSITFTRYMSNSQRITHIKSNHIIVPDFDEEDNSNSVKTVINQLNFTEAVK